MTTTLTNFQRTLLTRLVNQSIPGWMYDHFRSSSVRAVGKMMDQGMIRCDGRPPFDMLVITDYGRQLLNAPARASSKGAKV